MPVLLITILLLLVPSIGFTAESLKSTIDDQSSVALTVYNSNMGLVKDVRKLSLPKGEGELRFMDVASGIIPESVHVRSLNAPDKLSVLEQNYEYDLISREKLLDKYVGEKVKLLNFNEYQGKQETVEATLVSNNNGQIYEIGNEIYLGYPGYGVLPKLPENLIAKPTLTWLFKNEFPDGQDVEVSYLTNGVTWRADYVLAIDKDDKLGDLSGWVTLDNQSGTTYKDAGLKLVAGKVNVIEHAPMGRAMRFNAELSVAKSADAAQFAEQAFFEYHLYDLNRKTTVKDKEKKQVSLLEATGVPLTKEFRVFGQTWWFAQHNNGQKQKQPVEVMMTFKNSEADHLGMPLPLGIVRLYKEDNSGGLQFIGEDNIEHTPKDEDVKLKVGEAFDVVAERNQTAFQQMGRVYESTWEVTIRNHKKEDIVVNVVEPLSGFSDWEVTTSSFPYKKLNASTLEFEVPVAKDAEAVLTYTVRANY
ncbi:MAG: DUF4139 domain-containing protein [Candidatus Omnitrophica bacterium]|nr:DUF4139 domain-containing protein [Candidatus Omnitrophota bacterium]